MKPVIVTLTGPSCSGKTTLEKMLEERGLVKAISTTTRSPRSGEKNMVDYYFVTEGRFLSAMDGGGFVETVEFGSARYGLESAEVARIAGKGKPAVVVCEPSGTKQIAEYCRFNGWTHLPFFIGNKQEVILTRFLQRFLKDTISSGSAALAPNVARMNAIMTVEQEWTKSAISGSDYLMRTEWFDESNADAVADFIRDLALSESALKAA